jgi:arogenate dehydrogenase (NADP+)
MIDPIIRYFPNSRESHAGAEAEDEAPAVLRSSTGGPCGPLSIAIIGFGNFGQLLASRFVKAGQTVHATDFLIDQTTAAESIGVGYVHADPVALLSLPIDVVIIAVSVLSFASVLRDRIPRSLLEGRLVVDVLSVKEHPRDVMLKVLLSRDFDLHTSPLKCDVLCTHPIFGPESGRGSWAGLPFMYEKVNSRIQLTTDMSCSHCDGHLRCPSCNGRPFDPCDGCP